MTNTDSHWSIIRDPVDRKIDGHSISDALLHPGHIVFILHSANTAHMLIFEKYVII